uniref:G-protein coupled receptors family 1 profile domain-containing protein n=1 Tax=Panagrolaimus sp. JU765 TaxID=591449 RepID=A0AC34QPY3_9BILA
MDRTQFGADDLLRANLILYLSTIVVCAIVYSVALTSILRGKCQSKKGSLAWQTSDARLKFRLFIICFTNFIPFSVMIFLTYVSPPRTFIGNLFKTLFNLLNSTVNSTLLFIFSSLVRKRLPWPMSKCVPMFSVKQSTATKIEPMSRKHDATTVF